MGYEMIAQHSLFYAHYDRCELRKIVHWRLFSMHISAHAGKLHVDRERKAFAQPRPSALSNSGRLPLLLSPPKSHVEVNTGHLSHLVLSKQFVNFFCIGCM